MTDSWFVFNNIGTFLFKTSKIDRTRNISEIYNVQYIVKNPPGYDPFEDQKISYNIETDIVEFSKLTLSTVNVDLGEEQNIIDISELLTKIEENKQNIATLTSRISALETQLDNNSTVFNNIFPT